MVLFLTQIQLVNTEWIESLNSEPLLTIQHRIELKMSPNGFLWLAVKFDVSLEFDGIFRYFYSVWKNPKNPRLRFKPGLYIPDTEYIILDMLELIQTLRKKTINWQLFVRVLDGTILLYPVRVAKKRKHKHVLLFFINILKRDTF